MWCPDQLFLSLYPWFVAYMQVIKGKVEDVELPEKADILISEPMGKSTYHKCFYHSFALLFCGFEYQRGSELWLCVLVLVCWRL